jgi:DNA-nicking Smr family endonuclease
MSANDGRRRRVLTHDERVLWTTVTRSVAPLRDLPASGPGDLVAPATPAASLKRSAKPAATAPASPAKKSPPPLAPLGRRMKQRVVRGKDDIDGRLDLHGLTQSEAHATLLRFLRAASSRGARLVLVITGKGARAAEGERGVLKRQVPQWLGLPEFRALVIGFEDAHVAHGGEGALYVRVRRVRD